MKRDISNMGSHLLLVLSACLLLSTSAAAQGTRDDYERAATLRQRVADRVFRASVRPHWIGHSDRFWYRNDLAGGRREFLLVDPDAAIKRAAFDAARLATALSKTLGRPVAADRLPIERIDFSPDSSAILLQVLDKTYRCDLHTYTLRPSDDLLGRVTPQSPDTGPRASEEGGQSINLTFLNRSAETVGLFWIDTEAARHGYGDLKPGESRMQHTYAGHVWLAVRRDGAPLAVFKAPDEPALAVIDGAVPESVAPSEPDSSVSPDGKWKVITEGNNLALREMSSGNVTPLTHDGSASDAYDGQPVWSPDSRKFVIFKTVPAQEHKVYLIESSPGDQLQPKLHANDYLKPGDRIAHPRPHLFDIASRRDIPVRDDLLPNPWNLTDIQWEPDSGSFTFLYNQRGHQVMRLIVVDAGTGETRAAIDEQAATFIDWTNKVYLHRLPGTHEAIWMSERDGWNHLYLYDTLTGRVKNQITRGRWVVQGVDRVDDSNRQIWFRAGGIYPDQDPYYTHFCRVNFDGTGLTILTHGDGSHSIAFSPDNTYLLDTYSRVDLPPVTELRRADTGKKVMDLERGDDSELRATGWRPPERCVAKGRDGVTDIFGVIYRPSHFDPHRKYPIVEDIYAGPQGAFVPKVFDAFHSGQQMAELGFIVVQIDGMGTNSRSKAFHDVCWKNLSDAGFPDRILWIRAAAAKYPYMDLTRIGIYGTSAGGQNALSGLLLHGDFYRAGVADCGCHDNRMDKIWWNEQWMGWPVGPQYAASSNVTLARRLKGKLLLMVGEMDANVDPASTMQVVNALIKADRDFDLLVFPGAGHGVAGTAYGRRRMEDFLVRNLLGVEPRAR